jgi:16S rRNA (guanine527-N7)-methyltransferase
MSLDKNKLKQGAAELGLLLSEEQLDQFSEYAAALSQWNRVFNLTNIDSPQDILSHHFLDSLAVHPYVTGQRVIDVGTGAGFPGIPLAIIFPDKDITLLDSNGKKGRFLQQMKHDLNLPNCQVEIARVEQFNPAEPFDVILSRAFSQLSNMLQCTGHLAGEHGRWLALKANVTDDELAAIPKTYRFEVHALEVPALDANRTVVTIYKE